MNARVTQLSQMMEHYTGHLQNYRDFNYNNCCYFLDHEDSSKSIGKPKIFNYFLRVSSFPNRFDKEDQMR